MSKSAAAQHELPAPSAQASLGNLSQQPPHAPLLFCAPQYFACLQQCPRPLAIPEGRTHREWRRQVLLGIVALPGPSTAANGLGPGSRGESSGPGLALCSAARVASLRSSTLGPSAALAPLPEAATVALSLLMGGHKIYLFAIP